MRSLTLATSLCLVIACSSEQRAPKDLDAVQTQTVPSGRSEILAVSDPALNKIVVFGGNDGPIVGQYPVAQFSSETWVFAPGEGWSLVQTASQPSARGRYAAQLNPVDHTILLYGGRWREAETRGDYTLRTDLWLYDIEDETWILLDDGQGDQAPPGRYYTSAGFDAETQTFWMWGGALNSSATIIEPGSDLWSYDLQSGEWTEHTTTGEGPSRRTFLGDLWDPIRKRIVIFGGQRGDFSSMAFQDTWALDVESKTWTQLDDGTGEVPSTRMHAHVEYDAARDQYLLFGGHTDLGDMNDLWVMSPTETEWVPLYEADSFTGERLGCQGNPSEVPADYVQMDTSAPERRHRGMFAFMWDNIWIYGGIHSECGDYVNDTWRFDLADSRWHEVIGATTGEACGRRGDDCECLCY